MRLGLGLGLRGKGGRSSLPSGLVAAWRTDIGVTAPGGIVSSVASAYGLAANNLAPTTGAPTVNAITAPNSKGLINFAKASTQFMNAQTAVSGIAGTGYTVAAVISAQDLTANTCFLGQNGSALNQIGVQLTNGNIRVKIGSGTIVNVVCSPNLGNRGLHLLVVTYDGTTVNVYIDGQLAGTNASFVSQAWAFSQVGAANGASPFDGYLGPILIWNRALGTLEIASVFTFLDTWRGYNYYFDSAAGNDSSTTAWHSSTPWLNLSKANTFGFLGEETLAPKGGQIHRQTSNNNVITAGISSSRRMTMDGALWGTGRAEIRSSVAPTLTLDAGTRYKFTAATKPVTFVFYVKNGTVTFDSANREIGTNIKRLTEDTVNHTTPTVGQWGWDVGTTTVYVDIGVALADGDIEYVPTGSVSNWQVSRNNWNVKNLYYRFAINGLTSATANVKYSFVDVDFSLEDGIDASPVATATNLEIEDCNVSWPGLGYVGTGGSAGDGVSFHRDATVSVRRLKVYWAGKQGMSWHDSATVSVDGYLSLGQTAVRALTGGTGASGTATLKNVVGWIMTNANSLTEGIVNESALCTINAYGCSFYAQTSQGTGLKVSAGVMTAKDIVVKGFSVDASASGLTSDHICTHGITTANLTAGNGNLINTDPLFTSAATYDLSLQSASPCKRAGVAVSGLTTDYAGITRGNPPSIGAYE